MRVTVSDRDPVDIAALCFFAQPIREVRCLRNSQRRRNGFACIDDARAIEHEPSHAHAIAPPDREHSRSCELADSLQNFECIARCLPGIEHHGIHQHRLLH